MAHRIGLPREDRLLEALGSGMVDVVETSRLKNIDNSGDRFVARIESYSGKGTVGKLLAVDDSCSVIADLVVQEDNKGMTGFEKQGERMRSSWSPVACLSVELPENQVRCPHI